MSGIKRSFSNPLPKECSLQAKQSSTEQSAKARANKLPNNNLADFSLSNKMPSKRKSYATLLAEKKQHQLALLKAMPQRLKEIKELATKATQMEDNLNGGKLNISYQTILCFYDSFLPELRGSNILNSESAHHILALLPQIQTRIEQEIIKNSKANKQIIN